MFEASDRMNHLKKPKPRGQTLPPHAYNMDFSSSMRSNLSNFNSPQHLDDKIEEDQEDPNAGIELLERSDITNDEPVVEGKFFKINFKIHADPNKITHFCYRISVCTYNLKSTYHQDLWRLLEMKTITLDSPYLILQ